MKGKWYYSIADYANLLMVILFHQTILLLGEYALKVSPSLLYAGILAAVLVFSHFTRIHITHFVPYALFRIAVLAGLFFLPKTDIKIYFIIYIGILFFLDFSYWVKHGENGISKISIWCVSLNAIAYLYSTIKKNTQGMHLFFLFGLLFFILFYVRFFCSNAGKLAKDQSKDERMPFGDMIRNGLGIVLPFLVISVILMIFVRGDFLDQYIIKAYEIFLFVLGKIIKAFIAVFIWISKLLDKLRMAPLEEAVKEAGEATEKEPSMALQIASVILYILSILAILALFVRGVYNLIRMIPLSRNKKVKVFEESDMVEIREKIVRRERRKEVRLPKIRRQYKRMVEKEMRAGYALEISHTPRERAEDILNKRGNDIRDFSLTYEKERYSCDS